MYSSYSKPVPSLATASTWTERVYSLRRQVRGRNHKVEGVQRRFPLFSFPARLGLECWCWPQPPILHVILHIVFSRHWSLIYGVDGMWRSLVTLSCNGLILFWLGQIPRQLGLVSFYSILSSDYTREFLFRMSVGCVLVLGISLRRLFVSRIPSSLL